MIPNKSPSALREIINELVKSLRVVGNAFRVVAGYCFILFWWIYLKIRLRVLPHLPVVFLVVSGVDFSLLLAEAFEAADPRLHKVPHGGFVTTVDGWIHKIGLNMALGPTPLFIISIVSLVLAAFMVLHHHRVTHRVRQHLSLLNALRDVTREATRLVISDAKPQAADVFIEFALQVLVDATTAFKGGIRWIPLSLEKMQRFATVLQHPSGSDYFDLCHQWPPETYTLPLQLKKSSAAGHALEDKGIVYIPWTYFPHGIRLWVDETKSPHFRRLDFVKNAFVDLGDSGRPKPKSLICTEAPVEGQLNTRYVLCVDSNKWKCFDEVDYQAADLLASVIGIVFTELHGPAKPY